LHAAKELIATMAPVVSAIQTLNNQPSRPSLQRDNDSNRNHHDRTTNYTELEDDLHSAILLLQWLYVLSAPEHESSSVSLAARQCLHLHSTLRSTRSEERNAPLADSYDALARRLDTLWIQATTAKMQQSVQQIAQEFVGTTDCAVLFAQMLRILHLNVQPMTAYAAAPDASMATFLLLLPTIPRLNHSCAPNSKLILEFPLQVSVLAITDIADAEEITISYLDDLCLPVHQRQSFLQQAFSFVCRCTRCVWELSCLETQQNSRASSESNQPRLLQCGLVLQRQMHQYLLEQQQRMQRNPKHLAADKSLILSEENSELLTQAQLLCEEIEVAKRHHRATKKDNDSHISNNSNILWLLSDPHTVQEHTLLTELPGLLRDAAGVILQDYTARFQVLQQQHKQSSQDALSDVSERGLLKLLNARSGLILYGQWFLRSGQYLSLAYALACQPGGKVHLKRLEVMTMTALYGAVTARAYVEVYAQLLQMVDDKSLDAKKEKYLQQLFVRVLPPPREMLEALRGGISMAIEVQVIIKSVYRTSLNAQHRNVLTSTQITPKQSFPGLSVWSYLEDLLERACKAKRYCQAVFEHVGALHDQFTSG
jgi:hypothetical protein